MERYLLVEGVNIGANVYDTNQLSVVRGGSFLLKKGIVDIAKQFSAKLKPLSVGASSGFFQIEEENNGEQLCADIVDFLQKDALFSLLTFIVQTCTADSPKKAKEQLLGQLRFRQLQASTLVPDCVENSSGVSQWNGMRALNESPETITYRPPGEEEKKVKVSSSEKQRWRFGREMKQSYYLEEVVTLADSMPGNPHQELIDALGNYRFARDLNELSACEEYPDLTGKIAVFYADGNSFGKLQQDLVRSAKKGEEARVQRQFDGELQRLRQGFLAGMMREALPGGSFPDMNIQTRNDKNISEDSLRFETLLWGGDEMLFVMPAWVGFDFAQFFFEKTRGWKIRNRPLTHSAGLVLCSAKTPIRITRQLAQVIADHIKGKTAETKEGKRNAWDYMVLESIDYPAHFDYGRFQGERYGDAAEYRPICIEPGVAWVTSKATIIDLLEEKLPRRQLYALARWLAGQDLSWIQGMSSTWPPPKEAANPLEQREIRLLEVCEDTKAVEDTLPKVAAVFGLSITDLGQRAWVWLHLAELKDYMAPRRKAP